MKILHNKDIVEVLLVFLQHENFYANLRVDIKMKRLITIATWIPFIIQFKNLYNYHVIIQALNIRFLYQYYENFNHVCNFQMSHILCLIEIRIHHASIDLHKFINSSKCLYMSIHDGHELIMHYHKMWV